MSESRSYNLLGQPWIPVVWREDASYPNEAKLGIREAIARAHEIRCISHTAPFIEFGLYRVLITVVLDACIVAGKRPTIGKLSQMLESGSFDACVIGSYLEKYTNGFELWGDGERFLQRKPAEGKKAEAMVRMFAAVPSGTNVSHWNHFAEEETKVSEEVAAQFLTTVSPWNFKTKPGEARTLAGDPPMYALVLGESLFETLVLNLPRPSGRITARQEVENGAAWRTPLKDLSNLPKAPTVAQGFSWPVRIIQLEGAQVVAKAVNSAAYKKPTDKARTKGGSLFDPKSAWRDPNAGTVTSSDAIMHIKARPGVPVWRDAVPLFLVASEGEALRGEKRRSRPEVVTNALRLPDQRDFRVAVYGMRKKSDGGGDVKVEEWFRSVLRFPAEVARDDRLSSQAIDAFTKAQKVADSLQVALRMLRTRMAAVPREKKNLRVAMRGEADALSGFWQSLEPVLARSYLDDLVAQRPESKKSLYKVLREQARKALKAAAGPHLRDADGLFRVANASNHLERRLHFHLKDHS